MPDLANQLTFANAAGTVTPILGNDEVGGACYDGNGQALYAVYNAGAFQVWRTRDGYQKLRDVDASVDYLSTVLTATPNTEHPSTAIQKIGNTFYVSISAWLTDGTAGNWIYRDTGGAGQGPWVKHGTINALSGATGTDNNGMSLFTSEILVLPDGTWVANSPVWYAYQAAGTMRRGGVYTSADGGVTWTKRLDVGWYALGGAFGYCWSRNFGQFAGSWYVGGIGNVDYGKHYKSPDLVNWTDIGSLGAVNSYGYSFPLSSPEWIYRWAPAYDGSSPRMLQSAPAAPETMPLWANVVDTSITFYSTATGQKVFPLLCNIGPDKAQMWVATNFGRVLSIATTPTQMPPCRQYPREDGLGTSSATRIFPQPRSEQGGIRRAGGTYY